MLPYDLTHETQLTWPRRPTRLTHETLPNLAPSSPVIAPQAHMTWPGHHVSGVMSLACFLPANPTALRSAEMPRPSYPSAFACAFSLPETRSPPFPQLGSFSFLPPFRVTSSDRIPWSGPRASTLPAIALVLATPAPREAVHALRSGPRLPVTAVSLAQSPEQVLERRVQSEPLTL